MNVAFFGEKGSYTNQAAKKIFEEFKEVNFVSYSFLEDVFKFIKEDENLAVLPIENSNGGIVSQVLDMFPKYNFSIFGEYYLPINHTLLAKDGVSFEQIKEVYAHSQSLAQTNNFLSKHSIKAVPYCDNASAAKFVSKNSFTDKGVIGSEILASIYNLKVLKKDFQNSKRNTTRFLIIGNTEVLFKNKIKDFKYKTSIIFTVRDISGVLYKCLGGFATNGITLTKIESRPIKNRNFDYFFFLEFCGNLKDKKVISALEELEFYTKEIKIFGSYQKIQ